MRYLHRFTHLLAAIVVLGIAAGTSAGEWTTPDLTVAADGSGNFKTVNEAVQSIAPDNTQRIVILMKDGVYNEKVRIDAPFITLRGEHRAGALIEFSQLNEDFDKKPDALGRAVVNINNTDTVIENITIKNTAGIIGPHEMAIYGSKCDRTVIIDSDVLSEGADTVSLWQGDAGRYYHARCNFRGAVDFVCPRGWCYVTDCSFYETKNTAAVWHDGHQNNDMKFVLRNCKFDGAEGFNLARHHADAQFYFLDCTFSKSMRDQPPRRVIYPLSTSAPTTQDIQRNAQLDKVNLWGERAYFYDCHRADGDFDWHKDNLASADGSPKPQQITAAWTFAGKWDPESTAGPKILRIEKTAGEFKVVFSEGVTAKGAPRLKLADGKYAEFKSAGEGDSLIFTVGADSAEPSAIDLTNGTIMATQAAATVRVAEAELPKR